MGITSEVYREDISKDEKVKTNEVEFEHYMNMLQIRGDALDKIKEDKGSYNVEDVMKTMIDAYETYHNQIVKEHENGDRQVSYDITGDRSISLEEDLEGLDKAYKLCINSLEGYITAQQSNKILTSTNRNQGDNPSQVSEEDSEKPKYFDQEYQDAARSMMEEARKQFLSLFQSPDYKQGIGAGIITKIVHSNVEFMNKTQKLFEK